MVKIDEIKQLREETSVSLGECKKALEESGGDIEKAKEVLRKMGRNLAQKRMEKGLGSGLVHSYIHPNKRVGVMIELRCESDFVSKSEDFKNLAHELCLQIAAMSPKFISEEDIPEEILEKEKEIYAEQVKEEKKPVEIKKGIIEGKLKKYKEEVSLFSQLWIKDGSKKVKDLFDETVAKMGENTKVINFSRYEI
ncbi:MAG: elongation factor Ts [Candidatus Nealsonbacteria bacterium]